MRHALILLAGGGLALLAGTPVLSALVGVIAGACMILVDVIWQPPRPTYIDPVSRPRPATRRAALVVVGGMALLGIGLLWANAFAWPLSGHLMFRLVDLFFGGLSIGMALAMLMTERRMRDTHNRWIAAMSSRPDTEWKT